MSITRQVDGTDLQVSVDQASGIVGTSAWIEREQFVYFVTMARELGDPGDWSAFRDQLVAALRAAWGLDTIWLHLTGEEQQRRRSSRIATAYEVVDAVRGDHDPLTQWEAFADALWDARAPLTDPV